MMYPAYSNCNTCGGTYTLHGLTCQWQVTCDGGHVVAQIYGDPRFEGQRFRFDTRRDALHGLADLIYSEVA